MRQNKKVKCKFCDQDITTKNFSRHLERNHSSESEVINILTFPKNSRERRRAFILFRNDTNFNLFIKGITRPNRQTFKYPDKEEVYYPCAYCKGLYARKYLKRHSKNCLVGAKVTNFGRNHISASQTVSACAMDTTNTISKLNIKKQVSLLLKKWQYSL